MSRPFSRTPPPHQPTAAVWRGGLVGHEGGREVADVTEQGTREAAQGLCPPKRGKGMRAQQERALCLGAGELPTRTPVLGPTGTPVPLSAHAEPPSSAGDTMTAAQRMATRWHSGLRNARTIQRGGARQDGGAAWPNRGDTQLSLNLGEQCSRPLPESTEVIPDEGAPRPPGCPHPGAVTPSTGPTTPPAHQCGHRPQGPSLRVGPRGPLCRLGWLSPTSCSRGPCQACTRTWESPPELRTLSADSLSDARPKGAPVPPHSSLGARCRRCFKPRVDFSAVT